MGQGSKLSASQAELEVGGMGSGEFAVLNHGIVDLNTLNIKSTDASTSRATVSGFGEVNTELLWLSGPHSTLDVQSSGQVKTRISVIGTGSGPADVKASVRGSGSRLTASDDIVVGLTPGEAQLSVESGGLLDTRVVSLGQSAGAHGMLIVDGASSKLQTQRVSIGADGRGTFSVRNGATVDVPEVSAATQPGGQGDLIVENPSSSLQIDGGYSIYEGTGSIVVRDHAHAAISGELELDRGSLTVESAGSVNTGAISLGKGKDAAITVSGAGSTLDIGGFTSFGEDANAAISVTAGGVVTAHAIQQKQAGQAHSSAASELHVLGAGSRFTADSLLMLAPANKLEVASGGHAWLRNTLELGKTALSLNGGSLDVGLLVGAPEVNVVRVGLGGYLSADHPIPNVRTALGGTVHAGGSPGTLTVAGDYTQDPGGILSFSIAGADAGTTYSQLAVGGNFNLQGKIRISFEDGFSPTAGQTFDLITVAGAKQLSNYTIEIGNVAPGFSYSFAPFSGGYRLTALSSGQVMPPAAGDFNHDGAVDGSDLARWSANFGAATVAGHKQGDADGDGDVDGGDFLAWQRQSSSSPAVVSVPEPASVCLLMLSVAAWQAWRRSRS
jgi:T5SS/PEP-CTERM-associated repeat protein